MADKLFSTLGSFLPKATTLAATQDAFMTTEITMTTSTTKNRTSVCVNTSSDDDSANSLFGVIFISFAVLSALSILLNAFAVRIFYRIALSKREYLRSVTSGAGKDRVNYIRGWERPGQ